MSLSLIIWGLVCLALVAVAYYVTRMAKDDEDSLHDTGLAILEFGRAFPNEAIRSLHQTVDGNAIFVRTHDNKAGIMRNHRRHFSCHLIEPGSARVTPLATGRGFEIEFLDAPSQNGTFIFANTEDAAEVSLWLLGNLLATPKAVSSFDGDLDSSTI